MARSEPPLTWVGFGWCLEALGRTIFFRQDALQALDQDVFERQIMFQRKAFRIFEEMIG